MTVFVESGSLEAFLVERWAEASPHDLDDTPNGLCLLEGRIARTNLQRSLVSRSVPPQQAAEYSSIEDVATQLVRGKYGKGTLLNRHIHVRLIGDIITSARDGHESDALESLANIGRITEDTYLEELFGELNDYYRCTDAGEDHDNLLSVASDLTDQFARQRSEQTLTAFEALHEDLQLKLDRLPDWIYLSRSHLVRDARLVLEDVWQDRFSHIDWLAVATVNVLDNPTIRLFEALSTLDSGPDIHFFFDEGTRETLYTRLNHVGLEPRHRGTETPFPSEAGEAMMDVATGSYDKDSPPESVALVEAPDRRRETEHVATAVRERLSEGVSPTEILVVARNVDTYRPIVEDVFTNNEIPYQVETRQPMAHLAAYRFVKATVDLVEAEAAGRQDVDHTELTDPLRLGFCHPDRTRTTDESWPMPDRLFLRLEQELHAAEQQGGTRSVTEWQALAEDRSSGHDSDEWKQLSHFLTYVCAQSDDPPVDGDQVSMFLDSLLTAHIWCTVTDPVRSPPGPAVDPTRTDISIEHPTSMAERVRKRASTLQSYYDHVLDLFDAAAPSWDLVGQALGDVIGSEPFWSTSGDGNAITVIDAGLVDFREAEHMFVIGLSTEEFPIELTTPTFTHEALHEAAARKSRVEESEFPFLYYESRLDQYEQDLDSYASALRACTGQLTLLQFYLDSENDPVAWSPFVDFLDPDATDDVYVSRIRLDQWLPTPGPDETWRETWKRSSSRDRLRSYVFHAAEVEHTAGPRITQAEFQHLAFRTDSSPLQRFVEPRITRYAEPIREVTVAGDEPAFAGDLTLDDIVGGPLRPHEIDLFSQCQLKFYFYQLLFNFDGDRIERDSIPARLAKHPTSRFGRLPAVVRSQHASESFRDGMKTVITELLPDRQGDMGAFGSLADLRDWFSDVQHSESLPSSLFQTLVGEYQQVALENRYGIDREWSWVDDPAPVPISGTDVQLSPHRMDSIGTDGEPLPIYLVHERAYAERAVKQCWVEDSNPRRGEHCADICVNCGRRDDCSYTSKYTLDHRLHATVTGTDSIRGIIFQEEGESRPPARRGMLIDPDRELSGPDGDIEPEVERWTTERYDNATSQWQSDVEHHVRRLRPNPDVSFETTQEFVTTLNGCENCVYRELCQLPIQEERR